MAIVSLKTIRFLCFKIPWKHPTQPEIMSMKTFTIDVE